MLIHEWMFESRLFFCDKLISMGANIFISDPHRALVMGRARLRGARVESPDIRAGMAVLLAALCAEGRTEIGNIRQIDRGYERIDERLRELGARDRARRGSRSRCSRRRDLSAIVMAPDDPPDPQRDARRPARRDARAARDHRGDARGLRAPWLRRGLDADDRVRGGPASRGDGVAPAYRVFDDHGSVLALRPDMTVPIARVVATRYAHAEPPLRFCYFAHAYRARASRTAARCASSCRPASSWSARRAPDGTVEALTVLCDALDATGLRELPHRARRRRRCTRRCCATFGVADDRARGGPARRCAARDFVGLAAASG